MLMDFAAYVGFLVLICVGLAKSADLIENALIYISKQLHVNQFLIGFVILSIASSTPETMLMLTSAGSQIQALSVGNLLGGTIILLSLVLGINAIKFRKLPFRGAFGLSQLYIALLVILSSLLVVVDGSVTALEGTILIAVYVLYVIYLARHELVRHATRPSSQETVFNRRELVGNILRAVIGLLFLLILARLAVDVAIRAGEIIEIPRSIIGLLILAIGTNLPELIIALRGNHQTEFLSVGNALGSATVNTAIIGVLGVMAPFNLLNSALMPAIILLSMLVLFLAFAATTGQELRRREGIMLIGFYALMVVVELTLLAVT